MELVAELYRSHGYVGAAKLWDIVKAKKIPDVKLKDVQEFVAKQTTAQLHKPAPKTTEIPITVDGKNTEYQLDLLDFSSYARTNQGNRWCLILENVWDRRAAAIPCKTKSPSDVLPALKEAIKHLGAKPLQIVSDSGTEWKSIVANWLKDEGIAHREVELNDSHALGLINSFSKFIKNSVHKHFTHTGKTEWISYIKPLIQHYNDTPHSSLKLKGEPAMSPDEASKNETDTRTIHVENKQTALKDKKESDLAVGTHVRIMKRKQVFSRGYDVRYSIKIYQIVGIDKDKLWYTLDDGRKFREGSLQKVPAPPKGEEEERKEAGANAATQARREHRTDQILQHRESISQSNRREGLRERKPESQLMHEEFGRVRW